MTAPDVSLGTARGRVSRQSVGRCNLHGRIPCRAKSSQSIDRATGLATINRRDGRAYDAFTIDVVAASKLLWAGEGVDFLIHADRAHQIVVLPHQTWIDFAMIFLPYVS